MRLKVAKSKLPDLLKSFKTVQQLSKILLIWSDWLLLRTTKQSRYWKFLIKKEYCLLVYQPMVSITASQRQL